MTGRASRGGGTMQGGDVLRVGGAFPRCWAEPRAQCQGFLERWSGHPCRSPAAFLNRKPGAGLNALIYAWGKMRACQVLMKFPSWLFLCAPSEFGDLSAERYDLAELEMFPPGDRARQPTSWVPLGYLHNMQFSAEFGFVLEAPCKALCSLLALSIRSKSF